MTVTLTLSVPEAAALMDRSERTVWRQIRTGALQTRREGRRVLVLLDADAALPEPAYGTPVPAPPIAETWQVGSWPYTPAIVERHRAARLARRRVAVERMGTFGANVRSDPDGLTYQDYRNVEDELPRALDGGDAADLALDERARARRTDR